MLAKILIVVENFFRSLDTIAEKFILVIATYTTLLSIIDQTSTVEALKDSDNQTVFNINEQITNVTISEISKSILWNCRDYSVTKQYYKAIYEAVIAISIIWITYGMLKLPKCVLLCFNEANCYFVQSLQCMSDWCLHISLIFLLLSYDIDPWACIEGPSSIRYMEDSQVVVLKFHNSPLQFQIAGSIVAATLGLLGWICAMYLTTTADLTKRRRAAAATTTTTTTPAATTITTTTVAAAATTPAATTTTTTAEEAAARATTTTAAAAAATTTTTPAKTKTTTTTAAEAAAAATTTTTAAATTSTTTAAAATACSNNSSSSNNNNSSISSSSSNNNNNNNNNSNSNNTTSSNNSNNTTTTATAMPKKDEETTKFSPYEFPLNSIILILVYLYLIPMTIHQGFTNNNSRDEAAAEKCSCKSNDLYFYPIMYWLFCSLWWVTVLIFSIYRILTCKTWEKIIKWYVIIGSYT